MAAVNQSYRKTERESGLKDKVQIVKEEGTLLGKDVGCTTAATAAAAFMFPQPILSVAVIDSPLLRI